MKARFSPALVREDLRDFAGYSSARTSHTGAPARIWLNANEAASASAIDPEGKQRRYPQPQPRDLVEVLASCYGVDPAMVITGRGSDEVIDVIVRAVCLPGADGIVISSPTFGMYAVSARLHGVPVHDVPQTDHGDRWSVDVAAIAHTVRETKSKIVFLASPGNPTGSVIPTADLLWLATELSDAALLVVDEAYQEFSDQPSVAYQIGDQPNIAVLRTLSKAHGLAGARVGTGIMHPQFAQVLSRVQAPYPVPEPVRAIAVAALGDVARAATEERIQATITLRSELAQILAGLSSVTATYAGQANFVLVRSTGPDAVLRLLAEHGIVVRDMRHLPGLQDAIRVTVGTAADLEAIRAAFTESGAGKSPIDVDQAKQRIT
ncbi:histidinol-phosphate transaminase [Ornithinimicrobium sp. Arc0846-15]|nr:histidinol-phosphate transaminase [Ornithinimicrobium laminariae]